MNDKPAKPEDFYAQLLNHVDAGKYPEALQILHGLENERRQLGALSRIALDLEIDQSLDLDLSLTLFLDLTRARDLARSVARELARSIAHDLEIAHDLLIILRHVLERCEGHATTEKLREELGRVQGRAYFLNHAMQTLFEAHEKSESGLLDASGEDARLLRYNGVTALTADMLRDVVQPYLQALTALQKTIDFLKNQPATPLKWRLIGHNTLQIDGYAMPEVLGVMREFSIKSVPAEYRMKDTVSDGRGNAEVMQTTPRAEAHTNGFEHDARETGFTEAYRRNIEIAGRIVEKFAPDLAEEQRILFMASLIQPLEILMSSPMQFASI